MTMPDRSAALALYRRGRVEIIGARDNAPPHKPRFILDRVTFDGTRLEGRAEASSARDAVKKGLALAIKHRVMLAPLGVIRTHDGPEGRTYSLTVYSAGAEPLIIRAGAEREIHAQAAAVAAEFRATIFDMTAPFPAPHPEGTPHA